MRAESEQLGRAQIGDRLDGLHALHVADADVGRAPSSAGRARLTLCPSGASWVSTRLNIIRSAPCTWMTAIGPEGSGSGYVSASSPSARSTWLTATESHQMRSKKTSSPSATSTMPEITRMTP